MKLLSLAGLSLLITISSHGEERAIQIATDFERNKIAALELYLKENPEAKDRDTALRILVASFTELGDLDAVPDLLIQRYDAMPKTEEVNFQLLVGEISRPLVEASISSNQRDKAKAFLTRVKSDFADSPSESQIIGLLDQIGTDLYLPGVGDEMEFAFTGLDGEEIDLASMKEKVILIDFWATWCGPCIAALPHLKETYATYREKGFEIIGISHDENRELLTRFVEDNEMDWPQYFDAQGQENEIAQRYGIRKLPATFLVGKGGRIVAADLHDEELIAAIEKELAKDP